jgi:hypothetical protein
VNAEGTNLSASIHARLLNLTREKKRTFQEVLQYYAMERFLYRLSRSEYRDQFVLKGALMFSVWEIPWRRPTRDIDLRGYVDNEIDTVIRSVQEICEQAVEPDGMVFVSQSVRADMIQEFAPYQGIRVNFLGLLGKARVHMQLDIGFADEITPAVVDLTYPVLLDAKAPLLKGYPPEAVIAEKLHGIVFLGEINSRMKDFYDIWLLSRQYEFDGKQLSQAVQKTFARRETPIPEKIPIGLTKGFAQEKQGMWEAFLGTFRRDDDIWPDDFSEVIEQIKVFALPILENVGTKSFSQFDWAPERGWG